MILLLSRTIADQKKRLDDTIGYHYFYSKVGAMTKNLSFSRGKGVLTIYSLKWRAYRLAKTTFQFKIHEVSSTWNYRYLCGNLKGKFDVS